LALSTIGPYVSIATLLPVNVSMPIPASATPYIAKIAELHNALEVRNIPSEVINAAAAAGSCNGAFLLQVPEYIKENAHAAIDDHWHNLHPELKEAAAREESGDCPACGFKLDSNPTSCPDCGLSLGGPADTNDDDCSEPSGSCGPC